MEAARRLALNFVPMRADMKNIPRKLWVCVSIVLIGLCSICAPFLVPIDKPWCECTDVRAGAD